MLVLVLLVSGCSASSEPDDRPRSGCGPIAADDVRGPTPPHLVGRELDRFPNDESVCAALWLRTGTGFVPQGVVVSGGTAWVSGFDGDEPVGQRLCTLERYDVRTGARVDRLAVVAGQVGPREPVSCRHGGGLVLDAHGLWLVETDRLWLVDPSTLSVERAWALAAPLRGSFALLDAAGRIGIGGWNPGRDGRIDWFDPDAVLQPGVLDLTPALASGHARAPSAAQGAVRGSPGGATGGIWFARSVTRCGELVGPDGQRLGFVPGAEGMDLVGEDLWVLSESGTRYYQRLGGRPVVPQLLRLDVSDVRRWRGPSCTV